MVGTERGKGTKDARTRSFRTTLSTEDEGFFFEVPFDVKAVHGRARPPIWVTLNGHRYRSTVSVYGGKSYVPVRRSNREAAGVRAGDPIDVVIEADDAPRTVEAPADLRAALAKRRGARAAWDALSLSHRREHVTAIEEAKRPETRARRIEKALAMLEAMPAKGRARS